MAKIHYPDIWKSSYLLEMRSPSQSEFFTFSLPPESVEVILPQRVSETKTFGGIFFDDYGAEAARITLSGSTGNSDIKKIYRGPQEEKWLSGKEEIYYIRDTIIRYKENNDQYDQIKFYLYNLSTITEADLKGTAYLESGGRSSAIDSWEVRLKDFKITQSKDRPFMYNYSVEFLGLRILGQSKPRVDATPNVLSTDKIENSIKEIDGLTLIIEDPDLVASVASGALDAATIQAAGEGAALVQAIPAEFNTPAARAIVASEILFEKKTIILVGEGHAAFLADEVKAEVVSNAKKIDSARKKIDWSKGGPLVGASEWTSKIANPLRDFRAKIKEVKRVFDIYKSLGTGIISDFTSPFLEAAGIAKDAYGLYTEVLSAPADLAMAAIASFDEVMDTIWKIGATIEEGFSSGIIPEYVALRYASVAEAFNATVTETTDRIQTLLGTVATSAMSLSEAPDVIISPSGELTLAYGYDYIVATSETTLEALAATYLGDPDGALMIALCNGISGDTAITPGMKIKIPKTDSKTVNSLNLVYSMLESERTFGTDIQIQSGQLSYGHGGDLLTVSGLENVEQAIVLRLSESLGVRLRLAVYGIKGAVGQPFSSASAYVQSTIKDTIMQDPRIKNIQNFVFEGKGDSISIEFDYETVDGSTANYAGGVA